MPGLMLPALVSSRAGSRPDAPALIYRDEPFSYCALSTFHHARTEWRKGSKEALRELARELCAP